LARPKLESIGTLAGGIAHDFNNLLAGVLAEAELAATELEQGESPFEGLQRIRLAAGRGAEIVRELMTYSGQDKAGPSSL
jgi:two-component system, cell cycle sensor histidine kinase and response regulator CckA